MDYGAVGKKQVTGRFPSQQKFALEALLKHWLAIGEGSQLDNIAQRYG